MSYLLITCQKPKAKELAAFLVLGLILSTAIFLVILFSSPAVYFPTVTLVSLNVTKLNVTSANVSGHVDMNFQVINTNKVTGFSYDDVYCSLYHGKHRLATTMFPRFSQRARETKRITFSVYLEHVTTAREVREDTYALEEFDVELVTFLKWRFGSSKRTKPVGFSCNEVPVGLNLTARGQGKMIGPARTCKVF